MEFEFLKTGLIEPKPVGRSKKEKTPIEPIWNRYLLLSQETISQSIEDWEKYISKPESRSDDYYAAKNWNIVNREQFKRGKPAEVSCSMTVGRSMKFKIIPKYIWEGKGKDKKIKIDYSEKVGTVIQKEHNVMATLINFQKILSILDKESEEGQIFWKQAINIAKPKSKKKWYYDEQADLWLEKGQL